ncbi:DNA-directed RNA polymerase III subunit RPC1-like [Mytilus californianus]|uniref:DNA-directed RNA polymerase III subunit RPC1-like n=1 Tax=Mytilus californianus TaxID=6549 RepID=UPI0022462DC3|nr:DNA-directed RNA polymerase III subunit RPC1-like [Mytilus californianus]
MGIVTVLLALLLLSCIDDADSKTKLDDDDPSQDVGKLIETIKTILEIKNDIKRAYENVAKKQKSTNAKDKDCEKIDAATKPTTFNTRQPSTINNVNHSPPFKYSETVDKPAIGKTESMFKHTKSTGVEIYDILSKQNNNNDRNSLKIQKAGGKNSANKDIKKLGQTTEDVTDKISSLKKKQIVTIKLPKDAHSTSSKPTNKDSKKMKDSLTPTETEESQPSSAKVHSETNHNFKNKKDAVVIMPIKSQSFTINISKGDTVLPKTTKSVSEIAKSERKTSKSPPLPPPTNSMAQRNVTRNTVSVKSKTTVPKKSTKGGVMSLADLNSSNDDITLHKTSGPVNKIVIIPKSPLSSTKQNGIMDDGQKKNIVSSGSSATNQPNKSHNGKTELHSHQNTEPSITGKKPTIADKAINMVSSNDDENHLSISRNSKFITGINDDGNKRLLHKNDFSYTEKLTSQKKGLLDTNEPVKHNISKPIFNTADENQSSSNKEFSWKGVSGKKNRSSPLSKDITVYNDRIHTTKIQSEQTQTEVNNGNHVSSVTRTDSPIKNQNMKRTSDSSFLSVMKIEENLKSTYGQHDNDNEVLGKGHVTAEDKSNTERKSFLDPKDPMLNEDVREGTKKLVVGKISPSIITGNGQLATEAVESGQISMSPGLSNSNVFVVNAGPRFVNNQEHVPFSSVSIKKVDRKQTIDGLNLGQKKVSKLSDSNMSSNDDESKINSITTDYVPISKVANLANVSEISNITKTENIQVSEETNNQPKHNTVSGSIVTESFGIDQVVARNTLSSRRKLDSIVPTQPKNAYHLSKGTSINRNFFDQAVYGNRVQSINTLNVSPNEKTNTGNSIIINLKVHSNDENRFHKSFDKNDDSDFPKSGVSVKSLSTDSPVSSKTNGSLFVVTASLQSTPTKVRKAKLNKDKKKSFGTIFVPTTQMAGFVPMKTIVDPLEQFSKDKTEFTEDPEMKIKEKSDITERNISSGKATSMVPAGLTIQILSSKKDENKHKSSKNAMNAVSWKLKKTGQKAVITKPGK